LNPLRGAPTKKTIDGENNQLEELGFGLESRANGCNRNLKTLHMRGTGRSPEENMKKETAGEMSTMHDHKSSFNE